MSIVRSRRRSARRCILHEFASVGPVGDACGKETALGSLFGGGVTWFFIDVF
jgi:hypothetical protein